MPTGPKKQTPRQGPEGEPVTLGLPFSHSATRSQVTSTNLLNGMYSKVPTNPVSRLEIPTPQERLAASSQSSRRFGDAVSVYSEAGWQGVLPLPPGQKNPPPQGFTGEDGAWPTKDDLARWAMTNSRSNVALRLPPGVIGLDIDDYGNKTGGATLLELVEALGPLPRTWRSSSRDMPSGILFFAIPKEVLLPSQAGKDIDIIQFAHRYACVWPSVHPKSGRSYVWYGPDNKSASPPSPDDLPPLTQPWIAFLESRRTPQAAGYSKSSQYGAMSQSVYRVLEEALAKLPQGRHDAALSATMSLALLERAGHRGVTVARQKLGSRFRTEILDRSTEAEAYNEWNDLLDSAESKAIVISAGRGKLAGTGPQRGISVLAADVKPSQVDWLWYPRIPRGKPVIIDGEPGVGKSTLTSYLAAQVSTGKAWPDGAVPPKGGIVICSAEDGIEDTIVPRLTAAGADLRKIRFLNGVASPGGEEPWTLSHSHLDILEAEIAKADAALVIVDPLMAFLPSEINSHADADIRRVLRPLKDLAERTGATMLMIRHLNKAHHTSALNRGGGSIGIIGAARTGLLVAKHPEDESDDPDCRRVVAMSKSNVGPMAPSLVYRLVGDSLLGCALIEWDDEPIFLTADELLSPPMERKLEKAKQWLCSHLKDGEWHSSSEVKATGREAGYTDRTIERARAECEVVSSGKGRNCTWRLGDDEPDDCRVVPLRWVSTTS